MGVSFNLRTAALLVFGVALLTIVTLVNVVVAGYDLVPVMRANFDYEPYYWWSPLSTSLKSNCQPQQLLVGESFKTNNSMFEYTLGSTTESTTGNRTLIMPFNSMLQYSGATVDTMCGTVLGAASFSVTVDTTQKTVTGEFSLFCHEIANASNVGILSTNYVTRLAYPGFGSGLAIFLDSLGADVYVATSLVNSSNTSPSAVTSLSSLSSLYCPISNGPSSNFSIIIGPETGECLSKPFEFTEFHTVSASADDSSGPGSYPGFLATAVNNYFQGLISIVLFDLGIAFPNNIFGSTTVFQDTIDPNSDLTAALDGRALCPFSVIPGCSVAHSAASQLAQNISLYSFSPPTKAIIPQMYSCQERQIKSPLYFIVSVAVADVAILLLLYYIWCGLLTAYGVARTWTTARRRWQFHRQHLVQSSYPMSIPGAAVMSSSMKDDIASEV